MSYTRLTLLESGRRQFLRRHFRPQLLVAVVAAVVSVVSVAEVKGGPLTLTKGDVLAALGGGQLAVYDSSGASVGTLNTGSGATFTTGMATDAAGNLYVTNFSNNNLTQVPVGSGGVVGSPVTPFGNGSYASPESISFDKSGDFYVGNASSNYILKLGANGNTIATFSGLTTEDRGTDWVELAADQHTLYYTSEGKHIFKYDTATNTQLPDLISNLPGSNAFALRTLGDGSVLVADSSEIVRVSSTGSILQTYGSTLGESSFFALTLSPDGTSFYSGAYGTGNTYKFDIATGNVLQTIHTGSSALFGLQVYGEFTEGGNVPTAPEPCTLLLLGQGVVLAGLAWRGRRKQSIASL